MGKKICIGIPAFHAQKTIEDAMASIRIQSMKDDIHVIICDDGNDGDAYDYLTVQFGDMDVSIIATEHNGGPGVARSEIIKASHDEWIMFMDADDILYSPFSVETLYNATRQPNVIQAQGVFLQQSRINGKLSLYPHSEPGHPWSFARLTNLEFLQKNNINFGSLRAMEDGYFQWCIRLLVEGSPLKLVQVNDPCYVWREGSEHSITRIGVKDGIPQYNFDLCQIGAAVAAKRAIDFAREKNPFNGNILRFTVEQMTGLYFTYISCKGGPRSEFAQQVNWIAKYFYHECFKTIEPQITRDTLKQVYTQMNTYKARELVGIIPDVTFFDWFDSVRTEDYGGKEELREIRELLPDEVIQNDVKSGVLSASLDIFD